jgi:hypothetical protein
LSYRYPRARCVTASLGPHVIIVAHVFRAQLNSVRPWTPRRHNCNSEIRPGSSANLSLLSPYKAVSLALAVWFVAVERRKRERVGFILRLVSPGILVLRSRCRGIASSLQISGAVYSYASRRYEVFLDYYSSLDPFVLEPRPRL